VVSWLGTAPAAAPAHQPRWIAPLSLTPAHLPSSPQVFAALEDNVVTLSTMKASRYFAVFEREILYWEKALSNVSETIETILQVRGLPVDSLATAKGGKCGILASNFTCCSLLLAASYLCASFTHIKATLSMASLSAFNQTEPLICVHASSDSGGPVALPPRPTGAAQLDVP
jgi:hypothetical protein